MEQDQDAGLSQSMSQGGKDIARAFTAFESLRHGR